MRVEDISDAERKRRIRQERTPTPPRSFHFRRNRLFANNSFTFLVIAGFRCFRSYFTWSPKIVSQLIINRRKAPDQVNVTRKIQATIQARGRAFPVIKYICLGIQVIESEAGSYRIDSTNGLRPKGAGKQLKVRS